ncbi:MAG: hypothetical protein LKF52_08255 [Butyrivibrio sp.]|jgi:hypothetical protein|nr:hypothetical protein [Butyrivibrio sp.]
MSSIFREKSLERISSPEQLNAYIKVSNPALWMVLTAIIVFLAGVSIWGIYGHIETYDDAVVIVKDGTATAYVNADDIFDIGEGMTVNIGSDGTGTVKAVATKPFEITDEFNAYARHLGEMKAGAMYYPVTISTETADGTYAAQIVTERISPISFLMN